ncbi:LysR family transcriptional regulator [Roseovarius sp. A46]|uniref:LysR family transcriptional regulator n=1 Tax=Roseovarius sp. A46 TaxID=2109331 RepID=UPI001012FF82|nr:LysR family transcriptional regulator [Roseovarius sp. A46]RXV70314.1 LysR family transcriptional regulator [Roseovarius sp. A46]
MDWHTLPSLTALRAFAALAETGSTAAAGARLNVSHAAVSQQVRQLEAHLGVALVDRSGRQSRLTAEGRDLADALSLGFGAIARAVEALTGADAERPLQISTTPSFAAHWLMPCLSEFRQAHPQIDLMIDPTPRIVELEPGGIDIAVRYGTGHWPGLEAELLFRSPIVAVAAPHLVEDKRIECPADLADLPWLQEFGTNEASDWLRRRGVVKERAAGLVQVPGNLLLDGLRNGQGVAVTVREWVRQDITSGRLRLLFEDQEEAGYHVVTRPGVLRPPAKAFVTWLRRQARKTVPLKELSVSKTQAK